MITSPAATARARAVQSVRAQLGLSSVASSWSYEQRAAYNTALAAYIAARPAEFTTQDTATAARVIANGYSPLADASFDLGMFATEAIAPIVSVGEGVKTTLNASRWFIPIAAVAAVLILLAALGVRTGAARARQL